MRLRNGRADENGDLIVGAFSACHFWDGSKPVDVVSRGFPSWLRGGIEMDILGALNSQGKVPQDRMKNGGMLSENLLHSRLISFDSLCSPVKHTIRKEGNHNAVLFTMTYP